MCNFLSLRLFLRYIQLVVITFMLSTTTLSCEIPLRIFRREKMMQHIASKNVNGVVKCNGLWIREERCRSLLTVIELLSKSEFAAWSWGKTHMHKFQMSRVHRILNRSTNFSCGQRRLLQQMWPCCKWCKVVQRSHLKLVARWCRHRAFFPFAFVRLTLEAPVAAALHTVFASRLSGYYAGTLE